MLFSLIVVTPVLADDDYYDDSHSLEASYDIPEDAIIIDLDDLEVFGVFDAMDIEELFENDAEGLAVYLEALYLMEVGAQAAAYNVLMRRKLTKCVTWCTAMITQAHM